MCKVLPRAPNQMPVDVDYMNIYAETIWIMQVRNIVFSLIYGTYTGWELTVFRMWTSSIHFGTICNGRSLRGSVEMMF